MSDCTTQGPSEETEPASGNAGLMGVRTGFDFICCSRAEKEGSVSTGVDRKVFIANTVQLSTMPTPSPRVLYRGLIGRVLLPVQCLGTVQAPSPPRS